MGSGGMLPGPDPPVRAEVAHQSERTRVTRLLVPGGTVIRKEPLGPDAERRVRREVAMLERLRGVAGVAQLAEAPRYPGSVVLADAGHASLAGEPKPMGVDELTGLAVGLARAVAGMHRRGVMHRDITPANVVLSCDGAPCLMDFALASSFAEIRPEFTHIAQIAGTLAYLAPEATGRTGRPVDQRADLYALGATLYELATGAPPFGSGDPLQLTHDHLARAPAPPAQVNPAVPEPLSAIILHLLEKEPDHRYQTADGVVYDLERVQDALADPEAAALRVGEHDVPVRLLQPSRLAGRDEEVAVLEAAFAEALAGRCRGVLVGGAPGVGKTALADQLRPVVTGADGWFVTGKFDQYRRDLEFDAVYQAFRALGRLLLAEPDDELARVRGRILRAVGANAGLVTAVVPEFAALLAVPPDAGDPLTVQVRAQRAALEVLRAVASPRRPVAVFIDDLQWAGRTPLGFVDLVLSEEPVDGLLLVGAYREDDVDAAHPMAALLPRWRDQAGVRHLGLANLPVPALVTMVAEMLHVGRATAANLAEMIEPYTSGNPYETVELLNSLRREGVLTATAAGWRWDEAAVRAHLGRSEVTGLVTARVDALPEPCRQVVEAMACLGGRAELGVLQAAAEPPGAMEQMLAPALEDGLLVEEPGPHPAVRFRHDRIREVILRGLDPPRRRFLHLAMARRLAAVPELFAVAAEQYLPVAGAVDDPAERRVVAGLLRRAADQASLIGDYALVEALLAAALRLIDPGETALLVEVHTGRHAALYGLGRLEEADEEHRTIEWLCPSALERADATAVQVRSLTHRTRFAEAIALGIQSLRELGAAMPAADRLRGEVDRQLDDLYRRLDHTDTAAELRRTDISDPPLLAVGRLLSAMVPAAFFSGDHAGFAWLAVEALRIWIEHGPGPTLVGPASYIATAAVTLRGDYVRAYQAARRILALAEAHGYEPATSEARMEFSIFACWCEPVETDVHEARRAREGLIAGGNLSYAGYTYYQSATALLDCAPSLDLHLAEVEAGLAFLRRTGDEQTISMLDSSRWLAGVLRGEGAAATAEAAPVDRYAGNPLTLFHAHITRAVAAAIFGDPGGLARHTAAAMPLLPAALGLYVTAVARFLRALALAAQARDTDGDERAGLLAELDDVTRWLAARAVDAPDNFLHLLRLVEAERAWATGDFRAAALAFDAAQREAAQRQRPWHRALIAEHAARFYLAHGLEHAGYELLAQARREYLAWSATAKVAQLDWAYPALRASPDATADEVPGRPADLPDRRSTVTAGTIDLLAIVSASQALSSETSIDRLHARVAQVLSAMTGATGVHLMLWDEDRQDWLLPVPDGDGSTVPVGGTSHERAVPMSVLRYAQRTREPLVVADAARDDRFARDPYFADVACCSLLAVPILSRGTLRAVLLLENRLLRGAFTARRLDAVTLIAGQLAVSLDNAQLYAEFRQIVGEQAALRRVATVVAQAAPPEEVLAAVAEEAGQVLGVEHAYMGRYDPDGMLNVVAVSSSTAAVLIPIGTRFSVGGQSLITMVLQTGQPTRLDDYATVTGATGTRIRESGIRATVGAPVSVEGRLWGVLAVASTKGPLPAGTEARLAAFTELAATAIANAQARTQLRSSAEEQAALRRVATLVARAAPPGEVFAAVTEEAGRLLATDVAILNRYAPDGTEAVVSVWASNGIPPVVVGTRVPLGGWNVTSLVFETGQPARIDSYDSATGPVGDIGHQAGVRAAVGVPVSVAGELWGVMIVASRSEPLPAETEARLAGFTELAATAVANAEAQAEVTASRARIVAAADQARRRIERDLHDGAQQRLVSLALMLSGIRDSVPADLRAGVDEVSDELAATRQELRDLCQGVHPAILAEAGLGAAIRALARRSPIPVDLQVQVTERLPEPVEVSAYYVIAEALTNAAKHARASTVSVKIEVAGDVVLLAIRDDGAGGAGFTGGTGLAGLKDRVEALGGRIFLDSPRGAGTSLRVQLPLTPPTAASLPQGQRTRHTPRADPSHRHPVDHRPRHAWLAPPRRAHRAPPRAVLPTESPELCDADSPSRT